MQPLNANEHIKVHLSISIYTWKTGRSIGNGEVNQRCLHALATLYFYPLYSGTPRSDTSCRQKAELYVRIQLHSNGTTWRQRTIATLVAGRYA